jgi:hypothetical protein
MKNYPSAMAQHSSGRTNPIPTTICWQVGELAGGRKSAAQRALAWFA